MTSGKAVLLGAALLCGCGSSFTSGAETTDAASEAGSSADAETEHGPEDSGADASADVAHDAPERDASPPVEAGPDALMDAAPCTPLTFPLPPPAQCSTNGGPFITAPGRYWFMQSGTYACSSDALAASAACEMCKETYNCSCLRPLVDVGDSGPMCINGVSGPFFFQ